MVIELPEKLAQEIAPFGRWLPAILEISIIAFKTPAAMVASEVIGFLKQNPELKEVRDFQVSKTAQARFVKLLNAHKANTLSEHEALELQEIQLLNHHLLVLKASATNLATDLS